MAKKTNTPIEEEDFSNDEPFEDEEEFEPEPVRRSQSQPQPQNRVPPIQMNRTNKFAPQKQQPAPDRYNVFEMQAFSGFVDNKTGQQVTMGELWAKMASDLDNIRENLG